MGMQFFDVSVYAIGAGGVCLAVYRGLQGAEFGAIWTFPDAPQSSASEVILGTVVGGIAGIVGIGFRRCEGNRSTDHCYFLPKHQGSHCSFECLSKTPRCRTLCWPCSRALGVYCGVYCLLLWFGRMAFATHPPGFYGVRMKREVHRGTKAQTSSKNQQSEEQCMLCRRLSRGLPTGTFAPTRFDTSPPHRSFVPSIAACSERLARG